MRLLLDTHVFLWYVSGSRRLRANIRNTIRDPQNEIYLSVVSLWEAIIKHQLGKLPLPEAPESYLPRQRERHRILSLGVDEGSVVHVARLPLLHRDPFDRLIISQAIQHDLTVVTVDEQIRAYPVKVSGLP